MANSSIQIHSAEDEGAAMPYEKVEPRLFGDEPRNTPLRQSERRAHRLIQRYLPRRKLT
jgi:hypothetical protein